MNEINDSYVNYESENVDKTVSELFSGRLSLPDALNKLRTRLLDLSSRNRLLNYKHPKRRSVQFVDLNNWNTIFDRLLDNKPVLLKPVPEPGRLEYDRKRPEARQYAEQLGIKTSLELDAPLPGKRISTLQTLYYPTDLERQLRKVASEAKTAIEETGTNLLYVVFGFLEFYESDSSELPLNAPLLCVPVALNRGAIDPVTRVYQYNLTYSGEDINENHTLREKLRHDFSFNLPEFDENDEPETYLDKIHSVIKRQARWKVKRQVSLAMLSFGKLAIWADLDPKRSPGLLKHPLLKQIFEGASSSSEGGFSPEDHEIDNHPNADLQLIYDADSSQHSALIDVLAGKNMVINGPPGTGKSQTITNIIAAALSDGKKVLFVSEKLAALEVVRHRLDMANLGHFCLELHSHKTQKKKLLEDVDERLQQVFTPERNIPAKHASLIQKKKSLKRYAELIGMRAGNELGLTIHEIFWRIEKYRQKLGEGASILQHVILDGADKLSHYDLTEKRELARSLAGLYSIILSYDASHPWWGFTPRLLSPGEDIKINAIFQECHAAADRLMELEHKYMDFVGESVPLSIQEFIELSNRLSRIPDLPVDIISDLLPRFYSDEDPKGQSSRSILNFLFTQLLRIKELNIEGYYVLSRDWITDEKRFLSIENICRNFERPDIIESSLGDYRQNSNLLKKALEEFVESSKYVLASYKNIEVNTLADINNILEKLSLFMLSDLQLGEIVDCQQALHIHHANLDRAFNHILRITHRHGIKFDGSPSAVAMLPSARAIPEIIPDVVINQDVLNEAAQLAKSPFASLTIQELIRRRDAIRQIVDVARKSYEMLQEVSSLIGFDFDGSSATMKKMGALSNIAKSAPSELLAYRRASFSSSRMLALIDKAEEMQKRVNLFHSQVEQIFYLDALPDVGELKRAITVFRGGDRLFSFANKDWRYARNLFHGISRKKVKLSAEECATELTKLTGWIELSHKYLSNTELPTWFGDLYQGLNTDYNRIRRLYSWIQESQEELIKSQFPAGSIDLCSYAASSLSILAIRKNEIDDAINILGNFPGDISPMLEFHPDYGKKICTSKFPEYFIELENILSGFSGVITFFSQYVQLKLSPNRALQLLEGRHELNNSKTELSILLNGVNLITQHLGPRFSALATFKHDDWRKLLQYFDNISSHLLTLNKLMSKYYASQIVLADALRFIKAKVELDEAIIAVSDLPDRGVIDKWEEYADFAKGVLSDSCEISNFFSDQVQETVSIKDALNAARCLCEANNILKQLRDDSKITDLLGEYYLAEKTSVQALDTTHKWGQSIVNKNLTPCVEKMLLKSNPAENIRVLNSIMEDIVNAFTSVKNKLVELEEVGKYDWDQWHLSVRSNDGKDYAERICMRLKTALNNNDALIPWSMYLNARHECNNAGLAHLCRILEGKEVSGECLCDASDYLVYRSIGMSLYQKYPELAKFSGLLHDGMRAEYAKLDREVIKLNGKRIAHSIDVNKKVPYGQSGAHVGDLTEMQLIRKELSKTKRHIPIRQLVKRAGRALQELKPCFMMGPMSVAQYLEQGKVKFDIIIMDEASQLRPEDALGAIARGQQLVVVGDPKQLPPTTFFERMFDSGDEEEDDDALTALSGMESILDICQQLFHPNRSLRWHYRSQHESLISFSNHHFYKGNLIVFPAPFARNTQLGIRYHYLKNGVYQVRKNVVEAQRVVDAVVERMMNYPEDSLGVVTLNLTQRELIEDLLEEKLRTFQEGREFIDKWETQGWPFFIKNLENVQGDERDVIFISTTFGKAPDSSRVRQNFGPISRPEGWRRLNVLFTRARKKIELFSSMIAEDIIIDDKTPLGTIALHDYLDYARSGILGHKHHGEREPDSDFEISVADVIRRNGYDIIPQLGVAGFFIDIAVRNPDRPGEYLAGVECDGATYHSRMSVRDRDRIRQDILESLGWKGRLWRIWSTDWFANPRRETERLMEFLHERRRVSATVPFTSEDSDQQFRVDEAAMQKIPEVLESVIAGQEEADVFVEVGDSVVFCYLDKPDEKKTVLITEATSDPNRGIINEQTPLAVALLGLRRGEDGEINIPKQTKRMCRVISIQRQHAEIKC